MSCSIEPSGAFEVEEKTIFYNLIWLNTKEAAEYLRISPSALRTFLHRNPRVPRYKLGNSLRFKREDLDKFLESSLIQRIKEDA